MNVFTVSRKLILGRQTENGVTTIQFPIAHWIENYGSGGTFHLWNKRSQDANGYPVTFTSDDEYVYWTPTATDLAYAGFGECVLDYTFGTSGESNYRKAVSETFTTKVEKSMETSSTTPAAYTAWVTQVEGYADRAETAAEEAEESAEEAAASAASFHGIPSGGTAGQVLKKKSATDYDTEWKDESGGGGGTSDFESLSNRPSYNGTTMTHSTNIPSVPTKTSDLTNDSGFLTEHQSLSAYRTASAQDTIDEAQNTAINGKANSVHTHTTSQISDFPENIITKITAQNGLTSSTSSGQATIELSSENRTEIAKIANKQDSTDNTLTTTAKTVAGAINELDSELASASAQIANKQDTLVSGTNIKTINNNSLLGSGNLSIGGSGETWEIIYDAIHDWSDSPVSQVLISTDKDGNAFSLKKVKILCNVLSSATASVNDGTMRITQNGGGWSLCYLNSSLSAAELHFRTSAKTIITAESEICGTDSQSQSGNDNITISRVSSNLDWGGITNYNFNGNAGNMTYYDFENTSTKIGYYTNFLFSNLVPTWSTARILILGVRS